MPPIILARAIPKSRVKARGCGFYPDWPRNWIYLPSSNTLLEEVSVVVVAVAVSLLIGRQVDRRLEAQRNARAYADYAVRS